MADNPVSDYEENLKKLEEKQRKGESPASRICLGIAIVLGFPWSYGACVFLTRLFGYSPLFHPFLLWIVFGLIFYCGYRIFKAAKGGS